MKNVSILSTLIVLKDYAGHFTWTSFLDHLDISHTSNVNLAVCSILFLFY